MSYDTVIALGLLLGFIVILLGAAADPNRGGWD